MSKARRFGSHRQNIFTLSLTPTCRLRLFTPQMQAQSSWNVPLRWIQPSRYFLAKTGSLAPLGATPIHFAGTKGNLAPWCPSRIHCLSMSNGGCLMPNLDMLSRTPQRTVSKQC